MKVYDIISENIKPSLKQVPGGWAWFLPSGEKYAGFATPDAARAWAAKNPSLLGLNPGAAPNALAAMVKDLESPPTSTSSTGGTTTRTATGTVHTPKLAVEKGGKVSEITPDGKRSAPVSPKTVVKKLSPKAISAWQNAVSEKAAALKANSVLYRVAAKLANWMPVFEWIDDMEAIQVLYDEGWLGDEKTKAGDAAKLLREDCSTIMVSKLVSQGGAIAVLSMLSGPALRGLASLFSTLPGAGWVAGAGVFAASVAIPYFLQQEEVQRWLIENTIMKWLYPAGQIIGSAGGMVTSFISGASPSGRATVTSPIPQDWKEINLEAKNKVKSALGQTNPRDTLDKQRAAQQKQAERKAGIVPPTGQPAAQPAAAPASAATTNTAPAAGSVDVDDLLKQLDK